MPARDRVHQAGAAGQRASAQADCKSLAGQYLGRDGKPIEHPFIRRVVAPALSDLIRIEECVLAVGGVQKVELVLAGIRAGLCHVLITDEKAAAKLLGQ